MTSLFLYALFTSLFVVYMVIYFTHKYSFFIDKSDTDKPQNFHDKETPRAGGISIFVSMLLMIFFPFGLKFLPSIMLAFLSGIFEDFHNSLSPKLRLSLQLFSAVSAIFLTNSVVTYLGLGIHMPYWMGMIFSAFAIVGMMNAINIIDGFNGLASGVILLILISFFLVGYEHHNSSMLSIIVIMMGATLGFFILNFPKGKIFLGDGGAYLLGFIVAIIGIFFASIYDDVSPWYIMALFIYPVWEVLFSIIRKLSIGLSPLSPDAYHLHMLIYRQITKNNPLTSVFILACILPFMIASTFNHNRSITNIIIALSFIVTYVVLYTYLYKKDKKVQPTTK